MSQISAHVYVRPAHVPALIYRPLVIDEMPTGSIDLSKATKLKNVKFLSGGHPKLTASALKTVTPHHRNLRQISLRAIDILPDVNSDPHDGETAHTEWLELDSAFIKLWESHSIRPEVQYYLPSSVDAGRAREFLESLFPETTRRGVIDLSGGL